MKKLWDPENAPRMVPDANDVINAQPDFDRYDDRRPANDLESLENVVKAILTCMTGAQRLAVLNVLRDRESREGDWPYFVAEKEGDE